MEWNIIKTNREDINDLRKLFLQENRFQFIYDKCHYYGWSDDYVFKNGEVKVGYGCVWGTDNREARDSIFEFYVLQQYRHFSGEIFAAFCILSGATLIESQSNDRLLTSMLFEYARNINAEAILFEDCAETQLSMPGAVLHNLAEKDVPGHEHNYELRHNGDIVATGGLMLNYNFPYADIYMEVQEPFRGKGYGSFIVQELKKAAYQLGKVPAARCNVNNQISKATLLKAGFAVCGYRLKGNIISQN